MAKINFSTRELQAIENIKFFTVKKSVTEKVYAQFAEMKNELMSHQFILNLEKELQKKKFDGKISRGENLEGLPFIVLDFPAVFDNENIFCVRTLFWWGNYFSCSLILSGKYFEQFEKTISKNSPVLNEKNIFLLQSENIWNNNLSSKEFLKTKKQQKKLRQLISENKNVFKISTKIKLAKHDSLIKQTTKFFDLLNELLFSENKN